MALRQNTKNFRDNPSLKEYAEIDHELVENKEYDDMINERYKKLNENVNLCQPSCEFFKLVFKDNTVNNNKKMDIINSNSPNFQTSQRNI